MSVSDGAYRSLQKMSIFLRPYLRSWFSCFGAVGEETHFVWMFIQTFSRCIRLLFIAWIWSVPVLCQYCCQIACSRALYQFKHFTFSILVCALSFQDRQHPFENSSPPFRCFCSSTCVFDWPCWGGWFVSSLDLAWRHRKASACFQGYKTAFSRFIQINILNHSTPIQPSESNPLNCISYSHCPNRAIPIEPS
jgi:hypothetical protein